MSGFFDSLSATARALNAQQFGLNTVGQNLANVNTPGYAKRTVDLAEVPPGNDSLGGGGGVTVAGVHAARDRFTEQRLWSLQSLQGEQSTTADLLGVAQTAFGLPGESVDDKLNAFFTSWARLADEPTSTSVRQTVVGQGQALGAAFHQISDELAGAGNEADQRLRSAVGDVNAYATQIATLNSAIVSAGGPSTPQGITLTDDLRQAITSLSSILSINVLSRPDGQVDIAYASGRALVVGSDTYALSVVSGPPNGYASVLAADSTDVTATLTGGRIGGLLNVRDTLVPNYQNQLDTLAYAVVQRVNTQHAAGYDLSGTAGGNFFTPIATSVGAAAAVTVASTIVGDTSKIAAAGTTAVGDNQNARTMADLQNTAFVGGTATPSASWSNLVFQLGVDTARAQDSQKTYDGIVSQLESLRDATSGVSIDDEAVMMLKFQRAYQANARYFQTINSAIETLFSITQAL